jgi:hypothetical protein
MGNSGVFFLLTSVLWVVSCQTVLELSYSIKEEQEPRVLVGYVGQDSNISTTLPGPITYKFLENDNIYQYFEIESSSGIQFDMTRPIKQMSKGKILQNFP